MPDQSASEPSNRNGTSEAGTPARQRILDAAEYLFATHGFDRTPTAWIAEAAVVPQGLVFYHFRTKLTLFLELVSDYTTTFVDALHLALDAALARATTTQGAPDGDAAPLAAGQDDWAQVLHAAWEAFDAQLRVRRHRHRIVFQEMAAHPQARREATDFHQQVIRVMSRRLEAEVGEPLPTGAAPEEGADAVSTAVQLMIGGSLFSAMLYEHGDPLLSLPMLTATAARIVGCRGLTAA